MRKVFGTLAVACVTAATLIGCGGGGAGETESVPFKTTDASQYKSMLPTKPTDKPKKAAAAPAETPAPAPEK